MYIHMCITAIVVPPFSGSHGINVGFRNNDDLIFVTSNNNECNKLRIMNA